MNQIKIQSLCQKKTSALSDITYLGRRLLYSIVRFLQTLMSKLEYSVQSHKATLNVVYWSRNSHVPNLCHISYLNNDNEENNNLFIKLILNQLRFLCCKPSKLFMQKSKKAILTVL